IEGDTVYKEEALADRFNSFFSNIADNLNIEQNHNFECFDSPSDIFLSSFGNVTVDDVVKYINTLKSNSIGTDDICIKSIRLAKHVISEQLSYVINLSLSTSTFPDKLKTARLAILFKKGDRNSLNNYRPISILPNFSKIFEKAIYEQIYRFINPQITHTQYGFRKKLSCEYALLKIKECILSSLNNSEFILGIIIDFVKAFDCVDHQVLIYKLKHYGLKDKVLNLFISYL